MMDETEIETSPISELDIFKDALLDENASNQLQAVERLPSLASSLGISQTLQDLLPVLSDCVEIMHDEALCNIPEQLELFLPLVGGSENASIILNILVKLSTNDETQVRYNAVEAMKKICEQLDSEQCQKLFFPLIADLAHNDWFTTKCSASGLFAICYAKMDQEKKTELRNMFRNLVQDESPMVRRAAENGLVNFIQVLEVDNVQAEFLPVFHNLALDPQDSVRVLAIDVGLAIAQKINREEDFESFILPTFQQLSIDSSWRVRQKIALKIAEIQTVSGEKNANEILIIYQRCTKDDEAEVRSTAAENIFTYTQNFKKVCQKMGRYYIFEKAFQEELMTLIHKMIVDEHEDVRLALSTNILSLSTILSSECFNLNILPLILYSLEHDESMPFKENILKNLNSLPLDVDITKSFISLSNVLESLIENSKLHWRTRRNVLVALVRILKTSSTQYFEENIKLYYIHLLNDPVYAVRQTSCLIMPLLLNKFGYNWARQNLVAVIKLLAINSHYIFRRMSLFAINELIFPTLDKDDDNNPGKYLEIYRYNKEPKILTKVLTLVDCLKMNIENIKNKYENVDQESDFITTFNNDSKLYGEDTLEALKDTQIQSIFNHGDVKEVDYLQGVLLLLNQDFLEIIDHLMQDNITIIKNRAKFTLEQIGRFCTKITRERETLEWVGNYLEEVSDEIRIEIRNEVEKILIKPETIIAVNSEEQLLDYTKREEKSYPVYPSSQSEEKSEGNEEILDIQKNNEHMTKLEEVEEPSSNEENLVQDY